MPSPPSVPPLLRSSLAWAVAASLVVHGASLALPGRALPTEELPPPPVHVELLVKGQQTRGAAPVKAAPPRETPPTPAKPPPKTPPPPPRPAPLLTRAPDPTQPAPLQLPPQPPEQVATPTPPREAPPQAVASSNTAHAPAPANPGGSSGTGAANGPQGVVAGPDPTPIAWVSNRMPPYPRRAQERGLEGVVLVRVEVNTTGYVTDVEVAESSGYTLLDEAARNGARSWRFTPPTVAGRPVSGTAKVPVRFSLKD